MRSVDAIEITSRLVGHQNGRLDHESARQSHALLFAAGELDRVVIQAIPQADAFEQRAGTGDSRRDVAAGELVWQQDVFFGGQGREQLVALENESDFTAADQRQLVFAQSGDVDAVEDDGSRRGRIEAGEQTEQSAFAASRCPHDGYELSSGDLEVDTAQDLDAMAAAIQAFGEVAGGKNRGDDRHFFYYGG